MVGSPSTTAAPESRRERRLVAKARTAPQGGPPKHVSKYASTLQWWGLQTGRGSGQGTGGRRQRQGTTCRRFQCPARRGGSGRSCKFLGECVPSPGKRGASVAQAWRKAAPAACLPSRRGLPAAVNGDTIVESTATWTPPQSGKLFAMTSMQRSS